MSWFFANMKSPTSSPLAQLVNEKFSVWITRVAAYTPMTPNQMTFTNTVVGIIGAAFVARGSLVSLAIGGWILQLTAILDCCDGELARAKQMQSPFGAWIDTLGDNIIYVAYLLGLAIGYAEFASLTGVSWAPYVYVIGLGVVLATIIMIGGMAVYLRLEGLGGSMTAISKDFRTVLDGGQGGLLFSAIDKLSVLGRRAQFSLGFAVICSLPWLFNSAMAFHALFFGVVGFIAIANLYFILGIFKTRSIRKQTA